jgi:hypothetical protein
MSANGDERGCREMNARTAAILEKIEALPDQRIAEIEDFVDFIRQREEQRAKNWQVTLDAMQEGERGEVKSFATVEDLMADLHADD